MSDTEAAFTKSALNNEEFEASMSRAAIWDELEADAVVLCVGFSRLKPTLSRSSPPLHIALGTESGAIVVQELLEESPGIPSRITDGDSSVANADGIKRRLGDRVQAQIDGRVRSVDFSPDGLLLAAGGDDCTCTIFRLRFKPKASDGSSREKEIYSLDKIGKVERVDRVYTLQFSPNGEYLAVGGYDGTVAILSTASGFAGNDGANTITVKAEIPRDGLIYSLDWSPDGRFLAVAGSDRCCAIVDTQASWRVVKEIRRSTPIQSIKWFPGNDGRFLAIGASNVTIVMGREPYTIVKEIDLGSSTERSNSATATSSTSFLVCRGGKSRTNALCWSPNGSYLVICDSERKCTLLETRSFTTVHEIPCSAGITSVAWQQRAVLAGVPRSYLAMGGEDRKVVILKAGLETSSAASSIGDDLSSSANSSYFSTRSDWVLKENAFRDMEDVDVSKESLQQPECVESHVLAVAFSRGRKSRASSFFAYATADGKVTVRQNATSAWKVVAEIQFPRNVRTLAFSSGNRFLGLGCMDGHAYISDTGAKFSLITKVAMQAPVSSVLFSKKFERMAVGCVDGTLVFLDPRKSFDFAGEIDSSDSAIASVDWGTKNLAVGREDGSVQIYESEQVVHDFYVSVADITRKGSVRAISFGVSSRFLAVGDSLGAVGVYSAKGGWVLCHQVRMPGSCISAVRWDPVGRYLAYGNDAGGVKLLETVFWATAREVDAPSTSAYDSGNKAVSSLAFSQDGKMLAYARGEMGLSILDSTSDWEVAFSLTQPGDDVVDASSISSREDDHPCEV
jgi:WD40 repeat protein